MSRTFVRASSQYLEAATPPVTTTPFTLACWCNPSAVNVAQTLMCLGDVANTNYWEIGIDASAHAIANVRGSQAAGTVAIVANDWTHVCGVFNISTDRRIYTNGADKQTNSASSSASTSRMAIGRRNASAPTNYFGGSIALAAIWNVVLSDDEIALLAAGVHPTLIKPYALVGFWPLWGTSPEPDFVGSNDMVLNASPTVGSDPVNLWSAADQVYSFLSAVTLLLCSDAFSFSDSLTLAAALTQTESALLADSQAALAALFSTPENATLMESVLGGVGPFIQAEGGSGNDTPALGAALPVTDSAAMSDTRLLAALLTPSEAATLMENAGSTAVFSALESAVFYDISRLSNLLTTLDAAKLAESGMALALVYAPNGTIAGERILLDGFVITGIHFVSEQWIPTEGYLLPEFPVLTSGRLQPGLYAVRVADGIFAVRVDAALSGGRLPDGG